MKSSQALLASLVIFSGACQSNKKPPPRTEPWPAKASSASSAPGAGARLSYVIEDGSARVELSARKKPARGKVSRIFGTVDWDSDSPESVRGELKVDLLSLSLGFGETEDPELVGRAFDWLELSPLRPEEERERDRYAVLRISSCDRSPAAEGTRERGPVTCTARGELTLHRFRLPVALDVAVEIEKEPSGAPGALLIRTRKPLVVSLAKYDIQPRNRQGEPLPTESSGAGEIGREARISAELRALPSASSAGKNP